MKEMILFPNIGLEFEHVGTGISIFGFEITFFGILLGLSILLGTGLIIWDVYNNGRNMEEYLTLEIWVLLLGLIGARLYYVIFRMEDYQNLLLDFFLLRNGGMTFYGALIAGIVTVLVYAKIHKLSEGQLLDTACVGLAAGQILSSLGLYFNREGFGEYTNGLLAMQIPADSVSIHAVTETMRKHIDIIGGERYIQVEPLFLMEFIWAIGVLAVLILYKHKRNFQGELFLLYVVLYSMGQFWIEGLRVDTITIPGIGWKVVRVTAAIMIVMAMMIMIYMWTQNDKARMKRVRERRARKSRRKLVKKYW